MRNFESLQFATCQILNLSFFLTFALVFTMLYSQRIEILRLSKSLHTTQSIDACFLKHEIEM